MRIKEIIIKKKIIIPNTYFPNNIHFILRGRGCKYETEKT